jgi:hypothetical protein
MVKKGNNVIFCYIFEGLIVCKLCKNRQSLDDTSSILIGGIYFKPYGSHIVSDYCSVYL